MPFVAEQDVTLPRVIASGTDPDGNEYQETESVVYPAGAVVYESDIAPDVLERLDDGEDDHLSSLVKHVSEDEAEKLTSQNVVASVPEHEAEAEVFYQEGKDVLTHDEVVELNQNGDVVAEEVEAPDLSEGRKAEDPDSPRVKEVDERRRGEAKAPKFVPAAGEDAPSEDDEEETPASDDQQQPKPTGSRPKGKTKAEAGAGKENADEKKSD